MNEAKSNLVYPRLSAADARSIVAQRAGVDIGGLLELAATSHHLAAPNPTGGPPVSVQRLQSIQASVREVADESGFPISMTLQTQAEFDRRVGTLLFKDMGIVIADAGHHEVWSFITLVLLPQIPKWRFGDPPEARLLGGNRNTFQRLWWRAWSLGPDNTRTADGALPFGEDEFVQIMERTTLAGNRRLALALQSHAWAMGLKGLPVPRPIYLRAIVIRVRALRAHLDFDSLSDAQLGDLIEAAGVRALVDIGG